MNNARRLGRAVAVLVLAAGLGGAVAADVTPDGADRYQTSAGPTAGSAGLQYEHFDTAQDDPWV